MAASLLVHGWIAHSSIGVSTARIERAAPIAEEIHVILDTEPDAAVAAPDARSFFLPGEPASTPPSRATRVARSSNKVEPETLHKPQDSTQGVADPTYYGARDLDIYPSIASPLDWNVELAQNRTSAGRVQLLVLVNEAGTVEDATIVTAEPPGMYDEVARRMFLAARFAPGERGRRAVKTRLLIEVSFGGGR